MQALAFKRLSHTLTLIVTALVLAACGEGDGPDSTAGTPATTLPPIPPGFCDNINFEALCPLPGIENFNGGATTVIDNPDISGINTSEKVAQMQKFADEVFGGTKLNLGEAIDFSQGEFYKVKVWSPRPVSVSFKLEETGNPNGGLTVDEDHPGGSIWQELCFNFSGQTVPPPVTALTIIFDLGVLGQAAVDPDNWTFFYDDITQVSSCTGGSGGGTPIDPDSALYSTSGDPDLVIPDDYAEVTPFGSGSVIDPLYADDTTYSPVLAVSSGTGYGANIAQIGYTGFLAGFAGAYETVDFKVKGMPNEVIFVSLFDGVDSLRLNLTSSAYSGSLGDGWYQVSIPVAAFSGVDQATGIVFESDSSAPMQFMMLLTDIGFSGTGPGGPIVADPGIIPEDVIYATDPGEAIDLAATVTAFGTSSAFDGAYALDADFNPSFQAVSGSGYGLDNIVQLGFVDLGAGFASGYESFSFKIKSSDLPDNKIIVKLEGGGVYGDVVLTDTTVSTDLGNGWYQVVLPMSGFSNVDPAVGVLFEAVGPQSADGGAQFSFLATDIGFTNPAGGGGAGSGVIPEDVIYATDPGEVIDLAATITAFGTSSAFDGAYALDADFNPSFQAVSGSGYGLDNIVQLGFVDLGAGFASGYGTFSFKIKSSDLPDNKIIVKLEGGGAYGDVVLTDTTVSTDLGNGWYQVVLPMSGFSNVDPAVGILFEAVGPQNADGGAQFSFLATDIGFSTGGGGATDCIRPAVGAGVDLATNGDLETGDLTCWSLFDNGGTIQVSSPGAAASGFAINLDASGQPIGVTAKQANLGAGELTAGQTVRVSFDWRGTAAAGGVVSIVLFSELDGGGVSQTDVLQGGGVFPADWTTVGPLDITIGPDVSGGVTLEATAICGGDAGCESNLFIDNVSIVTP